MIYRGRTEGMNQWKSAHAVETKARTLGRRAGGRDVFLGLSAKGAVTAGHGARAWRKAPIIFAMANPDPEITPEDVPRPCAPMPSSPPAAATIPTRSTMCWAFPTSSAARSMCAPRTINEEMKIAAAEALAALAREDVPDEVAAAYRGARPVYGPDYIIPVPFDPRLISRVSAAVAEAAMKTGVARRRSRISTPISYQLSARLDPSAGLFQTRHRSGARQAQARGVRRRRRGIA